MTEGGHDVSQEFVDPVGPLPAALTAAVGYHGTGFTPGIHRGLPAPTLTFIFSLDRPVVTGSSPSLAGGATSQRNDIVLAGLHTAPTYISQPRVQSGIQLSVRPAAARALFGIPASELSGLTTEGADVLGAEAARIRERLCAAGSWSERFTLLDTYLRDRLERRPCPETPRAEVIEAWRWLAQRGGAGSVAELARHVMLSQRRLGTLFHAEFGVTPKAASKLMRFERARGLVAASTLTGDRDLSAIAQTCGYYDHSHLVREFRQHAGLSPTRWITEERENVQAAARHGR